MNFLRATASWLVSLVDYRITISVGPVHVLTFVLVLAAITSGALAYSVSDTDTAVETTGAATPGQYLVAEPIADTVSTVAAQREDVSAAVSTTALDQLTDGANATDVDGDGLSVAAEREHRTDPTDADTDGDGIPDGAEVHETDLYPGSDPLQQDIYVEVDATGQNRISAAAVARIETTFVNAPVENPNGENGINAHVILDDRGLAVNDTVYSQNRTGARDDIYDFRNTEFDARGTGYYYVLLTDDVAYDGEPRYVGAGRPGVVAMETFESPTVTASLFMHELGHAFGMDASETGVDEESYTVAEYDSVMNYNGLYEQLSYSDGSDELGRDEWSYVANERYQPPFWLDEEN